MRITCLLPLLLVIVNSVYPAFATMGKGQGNSILVLPASEQTTALATDSIQTDHVDIQPPGSTNGAIKSDRQISMDCIGPPAKRPKIDDEISTASLTSHNQEITSPWTELSDELVYSILRYLPLKDLRSCQTMDRRTASIIADDQSQLLPRAFWRHNRSPSTEVLFSQARYEKIFSPWLKEGEYNKAVMRLDKLKDLKSFHISLFYAVSQIKMHGDYTWEKVSLIDQNGKDYNDIILAFFSPDGQNLMFLTSDKTHHILEHQNHNTWVCVHKADHTGFIRLRSLSYDSKSLTIIGWHTTSIQSRQNDGTWKEGWRIDNNSSGIIEDFSPNGQSAAIVSDDDIVRILTRQDSGTWLEVHRVKHEDRIGTVAFSPNSRVLVTSSNDGISMILSLQDNGTWLEVHRVKHEDSINIVAFSPNSRAVVIASQDEMSMIQSHQDDGRWEVRTITYDKNIIGTIRSATFSPDNLSLVTSFSMATYTDEDFPLALYHALTSNGYGQAQASEIGTARILTRQNNSTWLDAFHADTLQPATLDSLKEAFKEKANCIRARHGNGTLEVYQSKLHSALFSPDSRSLMIRPDNLRVCILTRQDNGTWLEANCINHPKKVTSATFISDSPSLVTISNRTLRIINRLDNGNWQETRRAFRQEGQLMSYLMDLQLLGNSTLPINTMIGYDDEDNKSITFGPDALSIKFTSSLGFEGIYVPKIRCKKTNPESAQ